MTTQRSHHATYIAGVIGIATLLSAAPAQAQDTRAEIIAAKQAEKAKTAEPYRPSRFETVLARLEESFTNPPNGFYPEIGRIAQGGGFSAGLGYRHFYGAQGVFDIRGLYSLKNYKQIEVGTRTPWTKTGRLFVEAKGGWLDAP